MKREEAIGALGRAAVEAREHLDAGETITVEVTAGSAPQMRHEQGHTREERLREGLEAALVGLRDLEHGYHPRDLPGGLDDAVRIALETGTDPHDIRCETLERLAPGAFE